jgi:hypothetical protein
VERERGTLVGKSDVDKGGQIAATDSVSKSTLRVTMARLEWGDDQSVAAAMLWRSGSRLVILGSYVSVGRG